MKWVMFPIIFAALATPLTAQWLKYPTPGTPRNADGKPSLAAPAPRTADGKPDLSGIWQRSSLKYERNVAADLKPGEIQPWAESLVRQRAEDLQKDSPGIQCLPWIPGESFCRSSARCRTKDSAQGWISPGFRSAATLRSYFSELLCQIPDKSGLPSAVRGAGAARFGLPSALRGMPGVGYFSHCAVSGVASTAKMIGNMTRFIRCLLR